jgi:hypothetical protein
MIKHQGRMVRPAVLEFPQVYPPVSQYGWCWIGDIAVITNLNPSQVVEAYGPLNRLGFDGDIVFTNSFAHWRLPLYDAMGECQRFEKLPRLEPFGGVGYFVQADWAIRVVDIHKSIKRVEIVQAVVAPDDLPIGEITHQSDPRVIHLSQTLRGELFEYRRAPSGAPDTYEFKVGRYC